MSIYLHVGYPKAASTWFRKQFFPKVKNISLFETKLIKQCFIEPGAFDFNAEALKNLLDSKNQDIWISEELLTDKLRTGGTNGFLTKEIANRLKLVFPDAKIVIIIRNQIDMLASAYLQYVRGGGNYSINKFLFPQKYSGLSSNKIALLNLDFFHYHKVIEYYSNLFGKENVFVFLFEYFIENPQQFISLFAKKFNLDISVEDLNFSKVNQGYRSLLIFSKRLGNAFSRIGPINKYYFVHIPKWHQFVRKLHENANKYSIFGEKPNPIKIIGKKNYQFLFDFYKSSNQILIDEFGLSQIEKYNYPL